MRRILLVLCAALAATGVWTVTSDAEELPPPPPSTTTTSTTLPPAPTTTLPPTTTTAAPLPRPVDVPKDSYASEELRTIGRIEIPKLALDVELHQGVTLRNIDRGPSHWPGTALPGQPGNVVVMGHRVTRTKPFRHLDRLVPGDEVFFTVGGARSRYVVTGHSVVTPKQTEIANQTPDATGTLFACHPPGSARYRYVVHLKLA